MSVGVWSMIRVQINGDATRSLFTEKGECDCWELLCVDASRFAEVMHRGLQRDMHFHIWGWDSKATQQLKIARVPTPNKIIT